MLQRLASSVCLLGARVSHPRPPPCFASRLRRFSAVDPPRVDALTTAVDARFAGIYARLAAIEERIASLDSSIEALY